MTLPYGIIMIMTSWWWFPPWNNCGNNYDFMIMIPLHGINMMIRNYIVIMIPSHGMIMVMIMTPWWWIPLEWLWSWPALWETVLLLWWHSPDLLLPSLGSVRVGSQWELGQAQAVPPCSMERGTWGSCSDSRGAGRVWSSGVVREGLWLWEVTFSQCLSQTCPHTSYF